MVNIETIKQLLNRKKTHQLAIRGYKNRTVTVYGDLNLSNWDNLIELPRSLKIFGHCNIIDNKNLKCGVERLEFGSGIVFI